MESRNLIALDSLKHTAIYTFVLVLLVLNYCETEYFWPILTKLRVSRQTYIKRFLYKFYEHLFCGSRVDICEQQTHRHS